MSEQKLSKEKEKQIEALKAEWGEKIMEIPEDEKIYFNNDLVMKPYDDLEVEYRKKIKEVLESNN